MIKNNKGVTLVELLIVIVVMGIIAAFAIPAVGTIIENTNKDAVVADAMALENGARLYCASTQSTTCTAGGTFNSTEFGLILAFAEGISWADEVGAYVQASSSITKSGNVYTVVLEAYGTSTSSWEYDGIPSEDGRAGVEPDEA